MADTKGTDTPASDPVTGAPAATASAAENKPNETAKPSSLKPTSDPKTGPVKPPVLDLKARDTASGAPKGDAKTPPKPDTKPTPAAGKSALRDAERKDPPRAGFAFGAALTGGVLGLAAAYGLAWAGYWPATVQPEAAADPRLAQVASAVPELRTVTQTTQTELQTLNTRVAALEAAEPAPAAPASTAAAPDLAPLEVEITALGERIDALAAQPAPTAPDTSALSGELAALSTRLDELGARLGTAEAELRTLDTTVEQTTNALADQPSDIGAVLQLPLILSGLESAFATGRPFETELSALRQALPQADVPSAIADAAATGLARPDTISQRFAAVLPDMLAARPANPDAQWQDGALDWFRSAIALRPTGEMEGDTPEAVMSRLEAAVARRDFAAAEQLFEALPEPMRTPAGDLAAQIAAQADAQSLLQALRQEALAGEAAQ